MEPTPTDPPATGRAQPRVPASERAAATPSPRRAGRVRAIARAAGRTCSRPSCDTPAAATLVFSYHEQVARVVELLDQGEPQAYDLCSMHADRTSPPRGWELSDTRAPRVDAPRRLDDDETVAVLAAALRGETPPTRVSVLEGGRDQLDADAPAAAAARPTADAGLEAAAPDPVDTHALEVYDDGDDEDPLRAALEELQRVSTRDDDAAALTAEATPLRREAEPAEVAPTEVAPTEAAPAEGTPAAAAATQTRDDDLTLW